MPKALKTNKIYTESIYEQKKPLYVIIYKFSLNLHQTNF